MCKPGTYEKSLLETYFEHFLADISYPGGTTAGINTIAAMILCNVLKTWNIKMIIFHLLMNYFKMQCS